MSKLDRQHIKQSKRGWKYVKGVEPEKACRIESMGLQSAATQQRKTTEKIS